MKIDCKLNISQKAVLSSKCNFMPFSTQTLTHYDCIRLKTSWAQQANEAFMFSQDHRDTSLTATPALFTTLSACHSISQCQVWERLRLWQGAEAASPQRPPGVYRKPSQPTNLHPPACFSTHCPPTAWHFPGKWCINTHTHGEHTVNRCCQSSDKVLHYFPRALCSRTSLKVKRSSLVAISFFFMYLLNTFANIFKLKVPQKTHIFSTMAMSDLWRVTSVTSTSHTELKTCLTHCH